MYVFIIFLTMPLHVLDFVFFLFYYRMTKTGKLGNIVEDDYYRVIEVSRRMVNPRTVIFATSAINNNALKMDGFESLRKDNEVLRQFVANYKIPYYSNRGVQNVLLMDWEKLTDALVLANAETMNIPPEMAFKHQVSCEGLSKSHAFTGTRYCPHLTAMACAGNRTPNHPETIQTCVEDKRGRISPDGMHWVRFNRCVPLLARTACSILSY